MAWTEDTAAAKWYFPSVFWYVLKTRMMSVSIISWSSICCSRLSASPSSFVSVTASVVSSWAEVPSGFDAGE